MSCNGPIPILGYDECSFVFVSSPLQSFSGNTNCPTAKMGNEFDRCLMDKWDQLMQSGSFWYDLSEVKRKKIEGSLGFIAQLNTKRFANRRKPEASFSVTEPFPETKFNFTKIKDKEILFELRKKNSQDEVKRNLIIINVSPIEYGHILLVPGVDRCLPQVMDTESIKIALEMCLLSGSRALRLGFNSLCAYASVNHLHFHAFYLNHELPIDRADVYLIGNGLYELLNYVILGFALQMERRDVDSLARKLNEISWYFAEYNIPHNVYISRNATFEKGTDEDTIRVYVFPKIPVSGHKDTLHLSSCCFDVAGYLLLKDEEEYKNLTENQAIGILNLHTLRQDEFDDLKFNLNILLGKLKG